MSTTDEDTAVSVTDETVNRGPRGTLVQLQISAGGREMAVVAYADDGLRGQELAAAGEQLLATLARQPDIIADGLQEEIQDPRENEAVDDMLPGEDAEDADDAEAEPEDSDRSETKYGPLLADGKGGDAA